MPTTPDETATTWRDLVQLPPEQVAPKTARPFNATFGAMVAAFDERPRCEMSTLSGGKCLRSARWRIDLHGCEQAILCGHHKKAWIRESLANLWHGVRPRCAHCGKVFDSLDDAVRITAI